MFDCSASSDNQAIIVGVTFNISTSTEVFCQTNLYVAKICGPPGIIIINMHALLKLYCALYLYNIILT